MRLCAPTRAVPAANTAPCRESVARAEAPVNLTVPETMLVVHFCTFLPALFLIVLHCTNSTLPAGPSLPGAPAGPAGPWAPLAPFAPGAPLGPAGPSLPLIPFVPFLPVGPSSPAEPCGPCLPSVPFSPGSSGAFFTFFEKDGRDFDFFADVDFARSRSCAPTAKPAGEYVAGRGFGRQSHRPFEFRRADATR